VFYLLLGQHHEGALHASANANFAVALHDDPKPTTRRGMAFADAIFDGRAMLDRVETVRVDDVTRLLPVITTNFEGVLASMVPEERRPL
jgi:hypothetical protein